MKKPQPCTETKEEKKKKKKTHKIWLQAQLHPRKFDTI